MSKVSPGASLLPRTEDRGSPPPQIQPTIPLFSHFVTDDYAAFVCWASFSPSSAAETSKLPAAYNLSFPDDLE